MKTFYRSLFNVVFIFLGINLIQAQPVTQAQEFISAIKENNQNKALIILPSIKDINYRDEKGASLLIYASAMGYVDVCKALLDKGALLDLQTNKGATALYMASFYGHSEVIKLLIDNGATLDLPANTGTTALFVACQQGNTKTVKLLLEKGAKVDLQRDNGGTALIVASEHGNVEIVDLLLEKGAKVDLQSNNGETALIVATKLGYTNVVKALMDKGANPDLKDTEGKTNSDYIALTEYTNRIPKIEEEILQSVKESGVGNRYIIEDFKPQVNGVSCCLRATISLDKESFTLAFEYPGDACLIYTKSPTMSFTGFAKYDEKLANTEGGNGVFGDKKNLLYILFALPGWQENGGMTLGGIDCIHRFNGAIEINGYTFIGEGDKNDRLTFALIEHVGYVYLRGKGKVIEPSGRVLVLSN